MLILGGLLSCSKPDVLQTPGFLEGKWYYKSYFYSIGGPGSWHSLNPPYQYLELVVGGHVNSDFEPFNRSTGWKAKDSTTLLFTFTGGTRDTMLFDYRLDTLNHELRLSPTQPMCIEGCAMKFSR